MSLNLQKIEVVPLFGDMMVSPFNLVQGVPNFDESKWSHCVEMSAGEGRVDIPGARNRIKQQHDALLCQLATHDAARRQLTPKLKVRGLLMRGCAQSLDLKKNTK